MNLLQNIFSAFSRNAMLMIITQEILKENFRCPSQTVVTLNEAFVKAELVCGTPCPKI